MRVINPDHRLIAHKLTYLRDQRTDSPTFRRSVSSSALSRLCVPGERLLRASDNSQSPLSSR